MRQYRLRSLSGQGGRALNPHPSTNAPVRHRPSNFFVRSAIGQKNQRHSPRSARQLRCTINIMFPTNSVPSARDAADRAVGTAVGIRAALGDGGDDAVHSSVEELADSSCYLDSHPFHSQDWLDSQYHSHQNRDWAAPCQASHSRRSLNRSSAEAHVRDGDGLGSLHHKLTHRTVVVQWPAGSIQTRRTEFQVPKQICSRSAPIE